MEHTNRSKIKMKIIKSIFIFLSFLAITFIFLQTQQLYLFFKGLHPLFGNIILIILLIIIFYYIVFPLVKIFTYKIFPSPVQDKKHIKNVIKNRLKIFQSNKLLIEKLNLDSNDNTDDESKYNNIILHLKEEGSEIRKKYIINVFAGTTVLQNGFFDALIIFSANLKMIKELFELYAGRFEFKDFIIILQEIYYAITISEITEYAVAEIIEATGPKIIKSVPFLGTALESVTDGLTSAMLTARIYFIVENHLSLTYIESRKDLHPGLQTVKTTMSDIMNSELNLVRSESISTNRHFEQLISDYLVEKFSNEQNNLISSNSIEDICNKIDNISQLRLQIIKKDSNTVTVTCFLFFQDDTDIDKWSYDIPYSETPENYRSELINSGKNSLEIILFKRN